MPAVIDWDRLVVVDFETYFDDAYTLRKLSTSEYIRDERFKAQMVGIKIGSKPTKVYTGAAISSALKQIPWATHSLLAHHAQFDGFILFERFGISPLKIYDTLSMARALHNNDIGAGLDEVSIYYGGHGKVPDVLGLTKGVRDWSPTLIKKVTPYCANDVDETLRIFKCMHPKMPAEEMVLIDRICRMFTEPLLKVDRPRVQKELEREIEEKRQIMLSFAKDAERMGVKVSKKEAALPAEDLAVLKAKRLIGSNAFAELLETALGKKPPMKISPAWIKKPKNERTDEGKYAWAFSKTDLAFVELLEHPSARVRELVEARMEVKSTTNITRAGRFLRASENDACLPVYLKYSAAHTHRLGGGNQMNMQNLKRGGELRRSIQAPKGHVIVVVDSGQIEARTNGWLWGQEDLLQDFRLADAGQDRDAYCKFGDEIYGREITKADELERFVSKTCVLGLGYQMGGPRLQKTLALGDKGPKVFLTDDESFRIVSTYRKKFYRIKQGWDICSRIIEQMAQGITGSYKCIAWEKETIYLPNGMSMHYPNLHDKTAVRNAVARLTPELIDPEEDWDPSRPEYVYERKGVETKLYGGLLCENLCQALSRIIVMGQCMKIAEKYPRWAMSTHDEGAFVVKAREGEKALVYAQKCFSEPPAWAPDLPLNSDGSFDTFYSK